MGTMFVLGVTVLKLDSGDDCIIQFKKKTLKLYTLKKVNSMIGELYLNKVILYTNTQWNLKIELKKIKALLSMLHFYFKSTKHVYL